MNIKSEISRQIRVLQNTFICLQIPAGLILLFVLFLKLRFDIDTGDLTRDSNSVAHQPIYIGLVSNLGILFWCASATISLFTGWAGRSKGASSVESFLIYSGILSSALLLDDLLQLHEDFFPNVLRVPEELVLVFYGVLAIAIFYRYRKIILTTNYLILLTGVMLFGLSIVVDILLPEFPGESLIEDGAKFTGILTWFGYYASLGYETIKQKRP
ncbi:MAG: hypothetical protein HY863_19130 [Chloroflexi bacterium]|nr:hypothetical protein [Chloroflexota bacterium]